MELGLKNKVAIVTGGAYGLGKCISTHLIKEGAKLVIIDINREKLKKISKELQNKEFNVLAIKADISDIYEINAMVETVIKKFSKIDILVNNAGVCFRTNISKITESEWDYVLDVNLKGAFFVSQKVLFYMKQQKSGKIINIASSSGKIGGVAVGAHYSASKAGIICLTKSFAKDSASYGINVNAICPGVIGTEMTTSIGKEKIDNYKKVIPLGKIGKPDDVANAVLFLASNKSNYITGEIFDVDGGMVMD